MPESPESYTSPPLKNAAPKPRGVLPRNMQTWVVAGIAIVMVLVIALTGGKPANPARGAEAAIPTPLDPSPSRIQEYSARIEAETKKLAAEQAELEKAKEGFRPAGSPAATNPYLIVSEPLRARERTSMELEMEKREYESLFAPIMALTLREAKSDIATRVPESQSLETPRPSDTSPNDSRIVDGINGQYSLLEGTLIETTLTNRLNSSFAGPVNCMVTNNLYSHDRMKLLIPAGSRVLGDVHPVESSGQQRLAVTFHRLILPNGFWVSLENSTGLNQVGETGLRDKVDHHYLQVFGVSFAIGAIAGLAQATTQYGRDASGADVYAQGVSSSLSQSSLRILDRFLNILPTFTIQEGHRVNVYLLKDLRLPAYVKSDALRDF